MRYGKMIGSKGICVSTFQENQHTIRLMEHGGLMIRMRLFTVWLLEKNAAYPYKKWICKLWCHCISRERNIGV